MDDETKTGTPPSSEDNAVFTKGKKYRVKDGPEFLGEPFSPHEILLCSEVVWERPDGPYVYLFLAEDGSQKTFPLTCSSERVWNYFEPL